MKSRTNLVLIMTLINF